MGGNQVTRNSKLYFIHCMTPVHIGTGQGVGLIDLPIMRERVTGWPMLPGSSVKGVKKDYYKQIKPKGDAWLNAVFGKASGEREGGNAGTLVVSDSRLLAFPVASRYGTFAYVTCPLAIKRMIRDMSAVNLAQDGIVVEKFEQKMVGKSGVDVNCDKFIVGELSKSVVAKSSKIYLDEFESEAVEDASFATWARQISKQIFKDEISRKLFVERLVLVPDDAFQYFVTMCCEIVTRIRIADDKKTVEDGALWTEEYLPMETIFYGIVWCDRIPVSNSPLKGMDLLDELSEELILQIGGNATVGKGRICYRLSREAD